MNKLSCEEKKITEFLMSYPDIIPSPQEKSRMARRVEREIVKGRGGRMNTMDILFALLFLPVLLGLALLNGMVPGISAGYILRTYSAEFTHDILLYIFLAGMLITPLLLTILPVNKGGNE